MNMTTPTTPAEPTPVLETAPPHARVRDYWELTKPKVIALIVFTSDSSPLWIYQGF